MFSKLMDVFMLAYGIIFFVIPEAGNVTIPELLQPVFGASVFPEWWGYVIGAAATVGLLSILKWDAVSEFLDDSVPAPYALFLMGAVVILGAMKFGLIDHHLALPLNIGLFCYGVIGAAREISIGI